MSECPDCGCRDFDKCLKILDLMLDSESTPSQEQFFLTHIEKCMICFSHYNVEVQIRELLKSKIQNKGIPPALAAEIRGKIVR